MKKIRLFMLTVFSLCVSIVNAQQVLFKDTIWVPVTYYDFHSNKSNPEFEVTPNPPEGGVHKNMVRQTLDAEGKPVLGSTPYVDQYIKYWFRPWDGTGGSSIHAKGDSTIPVYDANNNFVNMTKVNTDTSFKNIVIHDSLPFTLVKGAAVTGTYQYYNQKFFPLDGKGFGNESTDENGVLHNYSFTMELKWPFEKRGSQTFNFEGDDDVWAFVNGQLAMDVGGIHSAVADSFSMNQFPNISTSAVCTLSVFYTERHVTGSDIRITTNIISPKINIKLEPDSSICLGDTVTAKAQIQTGSGVVNKLPAGCTLTWGFIDPLNPASTFTAIDSTSRRFIPTKISIAKIWGKLYDQIDNVTLWDTVTILINPCNPSSMDLYDSLGDPSKMSPLQDTIKVDAGTPKQVCAKLFNKNHAWLYNYEQDTSLANLITWTLSDTKNAGISSTKGNKVFFTSTVAWNYYTLTAKYVSGSTSLSSSVVIYVKPGPVDTVSIEPNNNPPKNNPQPFPNNTIEIRSNENSKLAYAVLRDQYGNFVRFSDSTIWSIDNQLIATWQKVRKDQGEVNVIRQSNGNTVIHVKDSSGFTGQANINILNYYYDSLKIVVKRNIAGKDTLLPIDSLVMNTNQDTIFYVIGKRSDNHLWEPTSANWEISKPLLGGNLSPSPNAASYSVSPVDTGSGWIRVTQGNDIVTKPDTANVMFTPGPPVRAVFEIITPKDQRIAGDSMIAVIKIYNKDDSLVRGSYCFQKAVYQDTLGSGGKQPPIVVVDSGLDTINDWPSTIHSAGQCFSSGLDSFKMVLYNAPIDNMHKIFVNLDNLPVAYTDPFHLYPGKIDHLDIENADGSSVQDPVVLKAPDDSKMFYAAGFDRFGNRIPGWALSNWSVSGNLNPVNGQNVGQIYYETGAATGNESGYLTAIVADTSAPSNVKDSVLINIVGPAINITRAVTRDLDGNGYLDHIELHFASPVTLPANFSFSGLSIKGDTTFTAAGIENNTGRTDSVWLIKINEVQNGKPQTASRPYISFDGNDAVSIAGANKVQCQDGAGPVVWYVENKLGTAKFHVDDSVTVTLSELVERSSGSSLTISDTPSVVFNVWEKNAKDSFVIVDKILVGINAFTNVTTTNGNPKQSVVTFKMTNGNDLTSHYYMNINTDKKYISDIAQPQNLPNVNNQKVNVVVDPVPVTPLPFPNPSHPDINLELPGVFSADHNPAARGFLQDGLHGGTITTVTLTMPTKKGIKIKCCRKIYDAVGNLVIQAKSDDLLKNVPANVSSYPIDFYWNEYTAQKSKAAPGVYMEVLYIEYSGDSQIAGSNEEAKNLNDMFQKGKYPFVIMHGVSK